MDYFIRLERVLGFDRGSYPPFKFNIKLFDQLHFVRSKWNMDIVYKDQVRCNALS